MKGQNQGSRGSNNPKNNSYGHRRSNSRFNSKNVAGSLGQQLTLLGQPGPLGNEAAAANHDKLSNLSNLVTRSIGKKCVVTVSLGAKYLGMLATGDMHSSQTQLGSLVSIVLKSPECISKPLGNDKGSSNEPRDEVLDSLVIRGKDLMDLEVANTDGNRKPLLSSHGGAKEVNIPVNSIKKPEGVASEVGKDGTFKTDSDIGSRGEVRERELERWVPDDDGPEGLSLEESKGHEPWDQFKVNEERFGVESTYDEHLYTTRINKDAPDYHERLKKADRIAKEIESQATSDRHILEERGIVVDDSGIDEEDKYSGVDRRGDELMAALRNSSISKEPSSSDTRAPGKYVPPRQRASQYHNDPAIISSSATKNPESVASGSNTQGTKASNASKTNNGVDQKPDSIPPKPQVGKQHNESFRLNAQSEINSLREFSANFKIPHKIPTDLLPILSKDKIKQDEILKKQQEQQKAKRKEQNEANELQSTTQVQPQVQQRKKFDATKPSFKLNPKAAAFTPTNKALQVSPGSTKANFHRSPSTFSPRSNNLRPYTSGSGSSTVSSTNSKRHHQISAAEFFGGADKVPTKEGQDKKINDFKLSFSMFVTTKKKQANDSTVTFEKTFYTPPTWKSTIDESYDKLFRPPSAVKLGIPIMQASSGMPFMPSPMLGNPAALQSPFSGVPGNSNSGKFPMSPHQQQQQAAAAMAAHFQQQQFHAAMIYQQQQLGVPPGQPPMPMYAPGTEPSFVPPGFAPPPGSFVGAVSPVNGNVMLSGVPYASFAGHEGYNNHHQNSGRRHNNHNHHGNHHNNNNHLHSSHKKSGNS